MILPANYNTLRPNERRLVREAYVLRQNGLCHYCHSLLTEEPSDYVLEKKVTPRLYPDGFFDNPVHLHHNHVTGLTIGAVHCYCNAVLWEHEGE